MTKDKDQHLEAIHDIRQMMKKSTRFLSLSGLSGVFAGIYALGGAYVAHAYLLHLAATMYSRTGGPASHALDPGAIYLNFLLIAVVVLFLSVLTAYIFSNRRAKKLGQRFFDHTAWRALLNLCIPLVAGGIFCLALLYHGIIVYLAPAMLLFYGLALVNASKYTYDDIRYLGLCEVVLGLINAFDLGHGMLYWAIGFGLLHIVYGLAMWLKYERKEKPATGA